MKKIVLILVIIMLLFFIYTSVTTGNELFGIKISSYKDLIANNEKLDKEVENLNTLVNTEYSKKLAAVKSSQSRFEREKEVYEDLAESASDAQLEAAMTREEIQLDYLWILVGNYANDNNVKVLIDTSTDLLLRFDVTGTYVSIDNFIYDLANDPELKFVIDNLVSQPGSDPNSVTKARFEVVGINVVTHDTDEVR